MLGWGRRVVEHGEAAQDVVPQRNTFHANWSDAIRIGGDPERWCPRRSALDCTWWRQTQNERGQLDQS